MNIEIPFLIQMYIRMGTNLKQEKRIATEGLHSSVVFYREDELNEPD